jgi:hypothetical protein
MRGPVLVLVLVLVLVPVRAITQDLPFPAANEISLGLSGVWGDGHSPEFLEYRDVPQGVTLPAFRLSGRAKGFDYDLAGRDAIQDDQRYRARVERGGLEVRGHLDDIPHRLGDVRTVFGQGAPGTHALPEALRRSVQDAIDQRTVPLDYALLAPIADDMLRGGRDVSLEVARREAGLDVALQPRADLSLRARYGHRRREGYRASGLGFGLQNAVEVAEPVDDSTNTIEMAAELERKWGVLKAGVQYDAYRNHVAGLTVDNPFRATDATAPGAQLGPNDITAAGARQAAVSVAPDNEALTANAGMALRLPLRTRVTADATFARWRQTDGPLAAFTTNTAITAPVAVTDPAAVPVAALDGDIHIDSQTVQVTSAPWSRLSVRGRFRRYEMDNRTPRVALPGVARLDAVWEAVPRLTVPYSHARTRAEATVGYGFGSWRLEAGHRQEDVTRTFREAEETSDTAWTAALSGALPATGHLRLHYEHAHRGFEAYDSRRSPGASRVNTHPVRSLGAGRRYDQADRDLDRVGARLEMAPWEAIVLAASYALDARTYPLTAYGLVQTRAHVASADASVTPGGRWNAHAFYAFERESSFQRIRHSPLLSISIDLRDIWDADLSDTVHALGAGLSADLDPGTTLRLDASYQRSDGFADFSSAPGGTPDLALDIAAFDDVRWATVSVEVEHRVRAGWSVAAGAWWETQTVSDVIDEGRPDYVPGAFVLAPRSLDYGVVVVQARVARRW